MRIQQHSKKTAKRIIVVAILIISAIFLIIFLINKITSTDKANLVETGNRSLSKPLQSSEINREFSFPIGDFLESDSDMIKYVIEKAEIRDQIVVQGKPATSIAGRAFLILNLKLTNDLDNPIEINTRDYIRLGIGGNDERLAADVHNDPVIIQPISTKNTRIAFPINKSDVDSLILYVGEIKGDKEEIIISF